MVSRPPQDTSRAIRASVAAMRAIALYCGLLATAGTGQEIPTAADVTEPGRTLARPLDIVLGSPADGGRTILVVLDPSKAVADAGFGAAFAAAVEANRQELAGTELGLLVVGDDKPEIVAPTTDHDAIVRQVRRYAAQGDGAFHNVYAAVNVAAGLLAKTAGERVLLLVALENGDVEDDVERVAYGLQKARVRVQVVTSEATLADTYWQRNGQRNNPRGTELTGPDAPAVDLPWGWWAHWTTANELTPAGFAPWGFNRLAAATDGRVFLYAAASQLRHECSYRTGCLFCEGDHQHPDDAWNPGLVDQLAPLAGSRRESLALLGEDPAFRAMIVTWQAAAREGLVSHEPAIELKGGGAQLGRLRPARDLGLFATARFSRHAGRAEKAADKAGEFADELRSTLEQLDERECQQRALAAARYTVVMLQLTRVNMLNYAAWCRQVGPQFESSREVGFLPPETFVGDPERRPFAVGHSTLTLCHGVKPYFAVELPGGEALRPELEKLDELFVSFQQRYGKSQFGYALRRNGLATYWPAYPAIASRGSRPRPKSGRGDTGPVTPQRPTRGGGSSGQPAGPTTGGGR